MHDDLLNARRVAPSILASDFARVGAQVEEVMAAGARVIHVDVMDGHFVPPISIGPQMVSALRDQVKHGGGWLDVHLMIERPERQIDAFAAAGADSISVHVEATPHAHYALKAIRETGAKAGLALNPGTPVAAIESLLGAFDLLLCMTVNPGWGGQPYIAGSEARIQELRRRIGAELPLEVDGGIDASTAASAAEAGATLFVAGSSIYGTPDPADAYRRIAAAAGA